MKTIRMSDFEANMLQSLNFMHGSVINELKIGRLIASVFEHKDIKKKFPYDFSGQGKLIAIMAIHLYMKKEGKVRIIHNDNNGERSIHLCVELESRDGETYYIDQDGVGTGTDLMRRLYLWSDCSQIKIEPFSMNSLRLAKKPYNEDTIALEASKKLAEVLESVIGEWEGRLY